MTPSKEPTKKEVKHAAPHAARAPREHKAASPAHPSRATHPAHATTHPAHATHPAHPVAHKGRYTEATGRRKTAVARVRIMAGSGKMTVNDKEVKSYFSIPRLAAVAVSPLEQLKIGGGLDVTVKVGGGGINAQAEAIRHGLSRAIILQSPEWKPRLRAVGFVTRDSRMVERKKYGLKKARRAPQWAKR